MIRKLLLTLGIPLLALSGGMAVFATSQVALAASPAQEAKNGANAADGTADGDKPKCGNDNHVCGLTDYIKTIVQILMFIIGIVAVIMIIIGGIRYTTSNGDSNQVAAAKNTVLYSVIGLIVAILSYAIVGFVIDQF